MCVVFGWFINFEFSLKNRLVKSIRWPRVAVFIAYCQTPTADHSDKIERPVVVQLNQLAEQLTHKYLLQATCTLSVNSSCQMITIALVALCEASQKYKCVITVFILLFCPKINKYINDRFYLF